MTTLFGRESPDEDEPGQWRARRALSGVFGLIYLVPLGKVVAGYPAPKMALAGLGLAAFVALYVATPLSMDDWVRPARTTWALLGTFAALAAALPFAFGNEWIGMPIYLSVVIAMTLPMCRVLWGIGAAVSLAAVQGALIDGAQGAMPIITVTTLSLGMFMFLFRHARILVQQLREARGEVARLAAADERLRIARDLHDLLGQSLSLIVLKSELARRVADHDPARTLSEISGIESVARQSLADVRATVSGYRRRDLAGELDGARGVLAAAEIEAVVRAPGDTLPGPVDGLFGWAVREGVTNVVRHSRAARVTIAVARAGDGATLEIATTAVRGPPRRAPSPRATASPASPNASRRRAEPSRPDRSRAAASAWRSASRWRSTRNGRR